MSRMDPRPTVDEVIEMRCRTGRGSQECRRILNTRWRRKQIRVLKDQAASIHLSGPVGYLLESILEFIAIQDKDLGQLHPIDEQLVESATPIGVQTICE